MCSHRLFCAVQLCYFMGRIPGRVPIDCSTAQSVQTDFHLCTVDSTTVELSELSSLSLCCSHMIPRLWSMTSAYIHCGAHAWRAHPPWAAAWLNRDPSLTKLQTPISPTQTQELYPAAPAQESCFWSTTWTDEACQAECVAFSKCCHFQCFSVHPGLRYLSCC